MITELIIKAENKMLYSDRPMDKRDLKKAGAYQVCVGGPWYAYDEVIAELTHRGYKFSESQPSATPWQQHPATDKQRAYLVSLGIKLEANLTKGRASELIEAAKGGYLGSVGGFYLDGSN